MRYIWNCLVCYVGSIFFLAFSVFSTALIGDLDIDRGFVAYCWALLLIISTITGLCSTGEGVTLGKETFDKIKKIRIHIGEDL